MSALKPTDEKPSAKLGAYATASGEERVLVGRRGVDGVVRIFDVPVGVGRRYFVEAGFDSKAELAVFCRRYLEDAARIGDSPMSKTAIDRIIDWSVERPREAIC